MSTARRRAVVMFKSRNAIIQITRSKPNTLRMLVETWRIYDRNRDDAICRCLGHKPVRLDAAASDGMMMGGRVVLVVVAVFQRQRVEI